MESEKTVENEEWRVATEPRLAALEAESATKSSRIEELEVEKQRMEVKVAALRESLAKSEGRVSELEASNVSLNTTRDEAIVKQISVQEELAYCKSDNYKKNILDDFKSSVEYGVEISREAGSYLDKGCVHIIRQLHHHFEDKSVMLKAFEANFDSEACRRDTKFVPYTAEEMEALRDRDERRGRAEWTPLPISHPTFWELIDGSSVPPA